MANERLLNTLRATRANLAASMGKHLDSGGEKSASFPRILGFDKDEPKGASWDGLVEEGSSSTQKDDQSKNQLRRQIAKLTAGLQFGGRSILSDNKTTRIGGLLLCCVFFVIFCVQFSDRRHPKSARSASAASGWTLPESVDDSGCPLGAICVGKEDTSEAASESAAASVSLPYVYEAEPSTSLTPKWLEEDHEPQKSTQSSPFAEPLATSKFLTPAFSFFDTPASK
eukprot:gene17148-20391_t